MTMLPTPSVHDVLRSIEMRRERPAVQLVELATRAAEEPPSGPPVPRRIPQPVYKVRDGGCRTCGHRARTHEAGYGGRRVPCKSVDCACRKYCGRIVTVDRVLAVAITIGLLMWLVASLAAT